MKTRITDHCHTIKILKKFRNEIGTITIQRIFKIREMFIILVNKILYIFLKIIQLFKPKLWKLKSNNYKGIRASY